MLIGDPVQLLIITPKPGLSRRSIFLLYWLVYLTGNEPITAQNVLSLFDRVYPCFFFFFFFILLRPNIIRQLGRAAELRFTQPNKMLSLRCNISSRRLKYDRLPDLSFLSAYSIQAFLARVSWRPPQTLTDLDVYTTCKLFWDGNVRFFTNSCSLSLYAPYFLKSQSLEWSNGKFMVLQCCRDRAYPLELPQFLFKKRKLIKQVNVKQHESDALACL